MTSHGKSTASFPIKVRFYELDPYGHVNHATYLQYFEAARVAWLGDMGQGLDGLQSEGVRLFVTSVATRFLAGAELGDELTITTSLAQTKRVQAQWAQFAWRGEELIACQRINFATVGLSGRPIRVPASLAEAMQAFVMIDDEQARQLPDLAL